MAHTIVCPEQCLHVVNISQKWAITISGVTHFHHLEYSEQNFTDLCSDTGYGLSFQPQLHSSCLMLELSPLLLARGSRDPPKDLVVLITTNLHSMCGVPLVISLPRSGPSRSYQVLKRDRNRPSGRVPAPDKDPFLFY